MKMNKPGIWKVIFSISITVLLFVLFTPPIHSDELPEFKRGTEKARDYFRNGMTYFHNHQYGASKESFIASLSVMDNFHLARQYLSETYYYSGEWQESLNELEILDKAEKTYYRKNRMEVLRLLISGEGKKHSLTFFNKIHGDSFRGFRFENPTDVVTDKDGNLYILSFTSANVIKLDTNGFPIENFRGGFGRAMKGPMFMAMKDDTLFVTDYTADKVYVFNSKGYYRNRFGKKGSSPGKFIGPTGICVAPDGNLYVSDSGNNRVQKLTPEGDFIFEFGTSLEGKLYSPTGVAVDKKGTVYVADKGNKRIVLYDTEGNYITEWKHELFSKLRAIKLLGDRFYISDEESGVLIYNPLKNKWTRMSSFPETSTKYSTIHRPFSTEMDYAGFLYTVDYAKHTINIFAPQNLMTSNLNVSVEKVITGRFPDISLIFTVKNRRNQNLAGIGRSAIRVIENENIYPLVGLDTMKSFNDKITVSMVFENSPKIKAISGMLDSFLGHFLSSFSSKDKMEVLRVGKDSEKVYEFGNSILDIYSKIRKSQPETGNFINLGKGVFEGISSLIDKMGPRAVILLVSGDELKDSFNQYGIIRNIQFAKSHSIPIIVLSLSDTGDMVSVYKEIAEKTGGLFFKVPGSIEEKKLYDFIFEKKDKRYIVSYKTKTSSELKGRYMDIQLDVSYREIIGKSKAGYFVP
jgi:DNA-binding beta-propeller fold protein YncE